MRILRSLSMSLALCAVVSPAFADDAKKPAPAPPKPADEVSAADIQPFIAFIDKLVEVVVADKDSCPKMAADVNKLIDDNAELMKKAAAAKAAGKQMPKDAKDHMVASMGKMAPGMQKCGTDKDVQKAFGRMDMSKKK